ncbi:hypothetical protein F5I97DRAFT_221171 [Phlebopus sp. FC_14]|nr:hypothetical protein F5I97DRAFT_221171 [Phlebopus sp. FC_14]
MPTVRLPTAASSPSDQGATNAQPPPAAAAEKASPSSQGAPSNSAGPAATQEQPGGTSNNSSAPVANGGAAAAVSSGPSGIFATTPGSAWQSVFSTLPPGQPATSFNSSTVPPNLQNWLGSTNTNGFYNRTRNHDEFYFPDGNALLQAEDVLFRVHWSILARHSKEFERMSVNSTNVFTPKSLGFTAASDFARLLTILYHPAPAKNLPWSADEWISVMEQAQRWGMQHIKDHAVQRLCALEMPPVMKITLWQKHKFDDSQLIPAYAALCIPDEPLSVETLNKLGPNAFVKVVEAREKLRAVLLTTSSGSLFEGKLRSALAEQTVESVFFPRH